MKSNRIKILLGFLVLAIAQAACTFFVGGPAYPATPIAVSTEAVAQFNDQLSAAQTAAVQSGILTLSINETQATSLLSAYLDAQTNPPIHDPQVTLRDGQIQVFGKATRGDLEANIRIVLAASVDANGMPALSVSSADFGPLPAPKELNDSVSTLLKQAFTGTFGPAVTGLRLETINIANGILTLAGRVN